MLYQNKLSNLLKRGGLTWLHLLVLPALILLLALTACEATDTGNGGGGGGLAPGGGATVEVTLRDGQIDMPTTVSAGMVTFQISNAGTKEHGFKIESQSVEKELEPHLQAGESGTLQVDLAPGTYEVYCPVDDHREEGMSLMLTVQ